MAHLCVNVCVFVVVAGGARVCVHVVCEGVPCEGAKCARTLFNTAHFVPSFFLFGCSTNKLMSQTEANYKITPWNPAYYGPSRAKSAARSLRRALLMPQVNTRSRYRCGKRT